jgi:hypothetical protein
MDARAREGARKGAPVTDSGCQSSDAYDAICSTGICPHDARDDDPSQINDPDTWDEAIARVPVPTSALVPLQNGDTTSLDNWLMAGKCATYTQQYDNSYYAVSSSIPVWSGMTGKANGYHRQVIVGRIMVSGVPCYIIWNSWGTGWGDDGYAYIPVTAFGGIAQEMVVHVSGVQL